MLRRLFLFITLTIAIAMQARQFSDHFCDSTLRLDYIMAGNAEGSSIILDGMTRQPGWAGRRHRLNEIPMRGDGQITVCDDASGDTIYRHSFCTLYQEWLTTEEASGSPRSFENSFLIPMPHSPAKVDICLLNEQGDTTALLRHRVDPADILIKRIGETGILPHRHIHRGGEQPQCIDIAILAEGYTAEETDSFYRHAAIAAESLLAAEPFKSLRDRINIVAVASPSRDSGVSIPRLGQWRDTAFGSHFSTFYSDRYLTTPNVQSIHNALAGIPYEHIIILANTDEYGGGGIYNSYTLTTARHRDFRPVVVHEFGHSFGGLADEYAYEGPDIIIVPETIDYEPWTPNVTSLIGFRDKWADMLADDTPVPTPEDEADKYPLGVFRGANYSTTSFYRPAITCRMRDNRAEGFCPVCRRALERLIRFYTDDRRHTPCPPAPASDGRGIPTRPTAMP